MDEVQKKQANFTCHFRSHSGAFAKVSHMKKSPHVFLLFFTALLVSSGVVLVYAQKSAQEIPIVKINKQYDKRTVIKKSTIPNAGNGLFALVKINKGEVIGELGGRLITDEDHARGNHYIASIPECAWKKTRPYKSLDSKDYGGQVSRINFAPSEINGVATHFQNAVIKQICEPPYVTFVALQDIEPGTEIWSTYGPEYDYDKFMTVPEVRKFFCGRLKINCRKEFTYSH